MKKKWVIPGDVSAKFYRWTVVDGDSPPPSSEANPNQTYYKVRCECGNEAIVRAGKIQSGQSKQCKACAMAAFGKNRVTPYHESKCGKKAIERLIAEGCIVTAPST